MVCIKISLVVHSAAISGSILEGFSAAKSPRCSRPWKLRVLMKSWLSNRKFFGCSYGEQKETLLGQGGFFFGGGSVWESTLLYLCIVFSCIYHVDACIDFYMHPTSEMNHFDKISDTGSNWMAVTYDSYTLLGTNMSHLRKRRIPFKRVWDGDMLKRHVKYMYGCADRDQQMSNSLPTFGSLYFLNRRFRPFIIPDFSLARGKIQDPTKKVVDSKLFLIFTWCQHT